ncbi:hypothetical protein C2I19_17050 [Chromobacterium alticapitis]|uniref:Uncharacterized protein n=1 Tax=Chromobacterium alticapitis TaxID=2073169 RepID=A0A2S5DCP5_9NEIS|nr:hypothetical protein C2I19_17050 [Chromobacterium alticapitis]
MLWALKNRHISIMQKLLQPPLLSISICSMHNIEGKVIQIGISKMLSLPTCKIICTARAHNFTHFISQNICTALGAEAYLSTNITQAVYFRVWNNRLDKISPHSHCRKSYVSICWIGS